MIAAEETIFDNDIMIAGLARLPKKYVVIKTVTLARKSSITLREFQAQLLGTEKEIEGEMNMLSQNMFTLLMQGPNSGQISGSSFLTYGQGSGSLHGASSSNSGYISATTEGTILHQPRILFLALMVKELLLLSLSRLVQDFLTFMAMILWGGLTQDISKGSNFRILVPGLTMVINSSITATITGVITSEEGGIPMTATILILHGLNKHIMELLHGQAI